MNKKKQLIKLTALLLLLSSLLTSCNQNGAPKNSNQTETADDSAKYVNSDGVGGEQYSPISAGRTLAGKHPIDSITVEYAIDGSFHEYLPDVKYPASIYLESSWGERVLVLRVEDARTLDDTWTHRYRHDENGKTIPLTVDDFSVKHTAKIPEYFFSTMYGEFFLTILVGDEASTPNQIRDRYLFVFHYERINGLVEITGIGVY